MTIKSIIYTFVWLLAAGLGSALIVLAGVHLYLSPSLPSVDSLREIRLQTPLRIYSYDGNLIGEIGEKRRTPVSYSSIPQGFIDALLSAEDAEFYSHNGVSIKGLMRASSQLLMSGDIQGGGSTITMQVARNFFLTRRQEFKRKFNEILLALRIERELSKQEILELYVNVIYLGNRAYGISAAAQVYYGKPLNELTTAQLAMIAGLPKAPSTMNPLANPARAKTRRNWILGRMAELGKISQAEYQAAIAEPLSAQYRGSRSDLEAQYIAEMARQRAIELYGLDAYSEGYRVYTTIRSDLQIAAQKALVDGLLEYDRRHGYRGPALTITPPEAIAASLQAPRGPEEDSDTPNDEQTEPLPEALEGSNAVDTESEEYQQWRDQLLVALADLPVYAGIEPAAVIYVGAQSITVLLENGMEKEVLWDHGLSSARQFKSVNSLGPKPESAADVVSPGDLIHVKRRDDGWHFAQIPEAQGALVSLDADTGAVLALAGGLDFNQSNFNRATQAFRQPGSNFKPFIYTAALEHGMTAATIVNDAPIVFEDSQLETDWRPENAGGKFYGPTRLRKALYLSRNLVSIRVLRRIGISNALADLGRFGFDPSKLPRDLSVALGSFAMTPMEIVRGYAVFANGGYQVVPYFIDRIEDAQGNVVYQSDHLTVCPECELEQEQANEESGETGDSEPTDLAGTEAPAEQQDEPSSKEQDAKTEEPAIKPAPRVVDARVAYIMDSMLKDVVVRGTATKAKAIKRSDIAGKTGTTNNATDAWFSGYGGGIVTTAWVGFDQVASLGRREYGGTAALPIWINYMSAALEGKPEVIMPRPPGLITTRINPETGKRAQPGDPDAIFEVFRAEYVPELEDNGGLEQSPWDDPDNISTEQIF